MDTALGRDVTRLRATTIITMIVLPLSDPGWTVSSSVNTLVATTMATYPPTSMPGAVSVSRQISAITLPVDWGSLVLLSSGQIAAKIGWPLRSCCSGGGQGDDAGTQIYKHTPSATLILIFPGICGTYLVTAVHLVKRIFVTNLLEICTHISGLCKCIHTKGYCMHTSTKYPPIYPPMTIYSHEGCLVHTYSKYSPTYTYCVLGRILEHQLQMSLDIKLK